MKSHESILIKQIGHFYMSQNYFTLPLYGDTIVCLFFKFTISLILFLSGAVFSPFTF